MSSKLIAYYFRTYAKVTSLRHYERQRRNRKNPAIASLHFVSVAMTNLRCVSPVLITYYLRLAL